MNKICLNIEVHQPLRLQKYRFFEISKNHYYYDDYENDFYINKISEESYIPVNRILLDLIHYSKKEIKVSFLFSGIVLDLFELYAREILESYKTLIDTGCVELLSGTYSNSFGPLLSTKDYTSQVKLQKSRIISVFDRVPVSFPGRHLSYWNNNLTYPSIRIMPQNLNENDNISFRVGGKNQADWLLKPEKLVKLLNTFSEKGYNTINLFLPYYNFGVSPNKNRAIIEFLESFTIKVLSKSDFTFAVPSEVETDFKSRLNTESPPEITGKKLESFYGSCNEFQSDAFEKLYSLREKIRKCDDPGIMKDWLYLQTCDHFHFMNPLLYEERESYGISLPYDSHFFAYINYLNILKDFSGRLEKWFGDHYINQKVFMSEPQKFTKQKEVELFRNNNIIG